MIANSLQTNTSYAELTASAELLFLADKAVLLLKALAYYDLTLTFIINTNSYQLKAMNKKRLSLDNLAIY